MKKNLQIAMTIAIIIIFLSHMAISSSKTMDDYGSRIWVLQDKIYADDGVSGEEFGKIVSLSGDTALIGVPNNNANGTQSGLAYIFKYNGTHWVQSQKIIGQDTAASDRFGFSVSIQGDLAVVGAPLGNGAYENTGVAYIFVRNGTMWSQLTKIYPTDTDANIFFGSSVCLSGNTILIGAMYDDVYGYNTGAVYVFTKSNSSNWTLQQKLLASDGDANDGFGYSISLYNNTTLIGALQQGGGLGAVYVFTRSDTIWTQCQKLIPSDGGQYGSFGHSISLTDIDAIIGAPSDGNHRGSVYVFKHTGMNWTEQQKIIASDGESDDLFGWSLSHNDKVLVVGMMDNNNPGAVYIFNRNNTTWVEQTKIIAPDGIHGWGFGNAVSMNFSRILIGALYGYGQVSDSGSAYVFKGPNQQPNKPVLNGPSWEITNVVFNFSIHVSDPDNDGVYCLIDWGEGNISEWFGPYGSGTIVTASHAWSQIGTFEIKVKIKDPSGVESEWSIPHSIDIHALEKTIMFGKYTNLTSREGFLVVNALNLRLVSLNQIRFIHYTGNEEVLFSRGYRGIMTMRFLIGCYYVIY
jgi:hypothetical protein